MSAKIRETKKGDIFNIIYIIKEYLFDFAPLRIQKDSRNKFMCLQKNTVRY